MVLLSVTGILLMVIGIGLLLLPTREAVFRNSDRASGAFITVIGVGILAYRIKSVI